MTASALDRPGETSLAGHTTRTPPGVWAGLVVVLLVAAAATAWGLARDPIEPYYAASARAMAGSWHDFAFGAFDPDGTLTMDKLPGAFWIQALAVRLLGPAPWVMVLPQVVEGVAAVAALFVAVRTLTGPRTGLLAAAILAVSPAAVALHRGNVADSLMLLLLTLAAAATARAVRPGAGPLPLLVAGVAVGLAFQAKMIEAWLILPALAVAYAVAGPGSVRRRSVTTLGAGLVALVVSLGWSVVVDLLPARGRPAVDGSARNSWLEQTFVYNGFGRLSESPLQTLVGQGLGGIGLSARSGGTPGWDRLLIGPLGRDAGWLIPLAVLALVTVLWVRRGRPRTDAMRAAALLWGLWLLVSGAAVSLGAVVNVYYAAGVAVPTAALVATGAALLWRERHRRAAWVVAAVGVAVTVGYGAVLGVRSRTDPLEARAALLAAGVALVVGLVACVVAVILAVRGTGRGRTGSGLRVAVVTGLVAVLVLPVTASAALVVLDRGSFDTPFETPSEALAVRRLLVVTPRQVAAVLPGIERARAGAPDLLAVQSAAVASAFAYPTGQEVLPIGGFTGSGPTPSVDQVRDDVARGRFHLVLAFPGPDARIGWIAAHCRPTTQTPPPFVGFYCLPADADRPG